MSEREAPGAAVVVGAGPGVGAAVARAFAVDGLDVGLVGRDDATLAQVAASVLAARPTARVERVSVDLTDAPRARTAIGDLCARLGPVSVLHVNPSTFREADPLELCVDDLLGDVALGVGVLLTAVQAARPHLGSGARVTATGSMAADEPWHRAASLGVQKAGLRNLVHSLDATLAPDGMRAVSVTVRGTLTEDGPFGPDAVAAAVRDAALRPDDDSWTSEGTYAG